MSESMVFTGSIHTVVGPSRKKVDMRETNGADDELISKIKNVEDQSYYRRYLSSIIVKDYDLEKKPSFDDVVNYKNNDTWYFMFKQRIINHGPELVFPYKCEKKSCKDEPTHEYSEDLSLIDGDLSLPDYTPKENQIGVYPLGNAAEHEFTISSQKRLKFDIMTGVHENKSLEIPPDEQDKNTICRVRNLKMFYGNQWVSVTSFASFSSREMAEIRNEIKKADKEFNPLIKFECPKCKSPYVIPLFTLPSFFWPREEV